MKSVLGPSDGEHVYALPNGSFLHEYEIRSVLGHGGFGITYRAFDTLLNESVAIKEYMPSYLAVRFTNKTVGPKTEMDADAYKKGVDAFLNEARTIARFRHHNITQVRRYFALNGTGYIVLNLEEGVSLDKILAKGRLPEDQLRKIFFDALAGLEVVHNGNVLHRDIKPNNIIVRPDGSAVLIDFGAARDFKARQSMTTIMSPGYAPPEQYGEGGVQGFYTDFYALGATAYQCISGKKPDDSLYRMQLSRAKKDPLVPAEMAGLGHYEASFLRLIDWTLRLNENERPQTVAEIRKYLESTSREKPKAKPKANAPHMRWKPVAAALAGLLLIGGGLYAGTRFFEPQKPLPLIETPKLAHPANVNELSHLANLLRAAGYDRAKLEAFQTECGLQCPDDFTAEFQKRMNLLDSEKQQFDGARDNADELKAYVQTCEACEFKESAEKRLSGLGTKTAHAEDSAIDDPALLDEIKDRLFEQNYNPGNPGSQEMIDAIHGFETKAGLPMSDQPTLGLLQRLRNTAPLGPWAAIVYGKEVDKWGMSWNANSRREALAEARARCGSDKCLGQGSFFAHRCGALARSARSWAISWRTEETLAHQAALERCQKNGQSCQIAAAVCADGSGHVP